MSSVPFPQRRARRPWFLPRILFIDVEALPSFVARKLGLR